MRETRSSKKDLSGELLSQSLPANRSPPKSPVKSSRRSHDAVDNVANEQIICKRCTNVWKVSSLNTKELETVNTVNNWYWLCEDCYKTLSNDEQEPCFLKSQNGGGFFDPALPIPTSGNSSTSQHFSSFSERYDSLKQHVFTLGHFFKFYWKAFVSLFSKRVSFACLSVIVVLIGICVAYKIFGSTGDHEPETPIEVKIENSFRELKESFPEQDIKLWIDFITGFKDIAKNTKSVSPAVFLILHSNNTRTSFCIIKKVCNLAHEHLKVSSTPLELDGNNFQEKYSDYGDFILNMKGRVESKKISVIKNLHKIPGNVARAFHGLTDAYNPLVEKVIYLMSIPTNETHHSNSIFELAEEILSKTWQDVEGDSLGPLVTRLTTNVLQIKDEINFPGYC